MTSSASANPILSWKRRLESFWHNDLWQLEDGGTLAQRLRLRLLRVLYIVQHGFREQQISLLGAALTFTSLMSLVPLLALSLSVLKGLGIGNTLLQQADSYLADMPQQFQEFAARIMDLVTNTNFAQLGGIGGLVLLTMVIQLLSRIETAFNKIWEVREERSWGRKITNYVSVIVLVPILLVAAITVTAKYKFGDPLESLGLIRLVPFFFTWTAFSFLYQALPHKRVHFKASVLGGLAGALLWQGWLRIYIWVQPGVTNYNVIYGTLASVPIFLAWLFISWQIVLLGALVSQAIQTETQFVRQRRRATPSLRHHLITAWAMLIHAGKALHGLETTLSLKSMARSMQMDYAFMKQIAEDLTALDLLAPTGESGDTYLLKRHPANITLAETTRFILSKQPEGSPGGSQALSPPLQSLNEALDTAITESPLRQTLADLLSSRETVNAPQKPPEAPTEVAEKA